jgi:hypothetical protein
MSPKSKGKEERECQSSPGKDGKTISFLLSWESVPCGWGSVLAIFINLSDQKKIPKEVV